MSAFALINDSCWKLIAQFAAPPDGTSTASHCIVSDILHLLYLLFVVSVPHLRLLPSLSIYTVYNLALSSKHFFDDIPVSTDEIERGAICQVDGLQSGKISDCMM